MKSRKNRKALGSFYTPDDYCKPIVEWAIRSSEDTVLEPSFGGCGFLKAARDRLSEYGSKDPLSQIWGVDIDPDAHQILHENNLWRPDQFLQADFLTQTARHPRKRPVSTVVGNPPYIPWNSLSDQQRETALRIANHNISGQANLWAFFCLAALEHLSPNGRLGFVLSTSMLKSGYGTQILEYLSSNFSQIKVIHVQEECFRHHGTSEKASILLAEGFGQSKKSEVAIANVTDSNEFTDLIRGKISQPTTNRRESNGPNLLESDPFIPGRDRQLGDMCEIKIGVVTGNNKFFLLNRSRLQEIGLSEDHCLIVVNRGKTCPRLRFNETDIKRAIQQDREVFMLDTRENATAHRVRAYLKTYPPQRLKTNITFQKSSAWHQPKLGNVGDAFFVYMAHRGPRLILNEAKVHATNSLYCLFLTEGVTNEQMKWASLFLSTRYGKILAEKIGNRYSGGLLKFEPNTARKLPIMMPSNLRIGKLNTAWREANLLLLRNLTHEAHEVIEQFVERELSPERDLHQLIRGQT